MTLLSFATADAYWCVEQGFREKKQHAGFTPKGVIAVIANQLIIVAETLIKARNELMSSISGSTEEYARPSVFVLNGLMASALIGLQGVHDAIASFCQQQAPDEEFQGDIYFSTYKFRVTKFEFIQLQKQMIMAHEFDGKNVNELANGCKHNLAWLGLVSMNVDGCNDIIDSNRCRLLRDVLVPIYDQTNSILMRLGAMYHQPLMFPSI